MGCAEKLGWFYTPHRGSVGKSLVAVPPLEGRFEGGGGAAVPALQRAKLH